MIEKVVLLNGGGLDSLVAAAWLGKMYEVHSLYVNYGQRAAGAEACAAKRIAEKYCSEAHHCAMVLPFLEDGAMFDTTKSVAVENGKSDHVIVPMRNVILLSIAAALAETLGTSLIAAGFMGSCEYGVDPAPDANHTMCSHLERAFSKASYAWTAKPEILLPLSGKTKDEIAKIGRRLDADFSLMYSCYSGEAQPCGTCDHCLTNSRLGLL